MPLKPAVSTDAKQVVKAAFDQLDKIILQQDSQAFSSTVLDDVRKAALALEEQLACRRSLRNMRRLLPLFAGLEHYGKSMEILCNGTPYLPWVWAPITLVLRIASEYAEAFEKLIKAYSRIAESLQRFKILQDALNADRDFQQTLAVFYANILQFHGQAYIFVRRKSWKLLFLTSWGRFERRFDNILDDMKRHEELIDLQASAHSVSDIRQMRESIKSWREESLQHLAKWREKQATKQFDSIVSWLKSDESDQIAILDTISTEGSKFVGTCSWVLANTRIKSWLQRNSESLVLWLQGTPGSGKSVLASQLVKFMKTANMFYVYHFCSQRYASSTTYDQILRSLLVQLLRKDDELIAHVYDDCVLGKKSPTIQALEKLLHSLFTATSHGPRQSEYIWVIIDGLNECDARTESSVVNLINQVTSKLSGAGDTVCKILVSSRHSSHISNRLRAKQTLSLTEERSSIKQAIRQYVSQRLREMHDKLAQLDLLRKDIEQIERVITNKADGMFLYARLVLDYLSKNIFFSGKEMKESIDELPVELTEFYRKILVQILVQLDARSVDRVKCIFGWIAFAKRPLKRIEFLSALTFSSGDTEVGNLVPRYVLQICGALIEERPDTTMTFIHISVKEFLQSPSSNITISEAKANEEHCISSLACLLCGYHVFLGDTTQHSRALRVVKGIHGFHVYATEYWTEYLLEYVTNHDEKKHSPILELASRLASKFTPMPPATVEQDHAAAVYPLNEKLKFLEKWPALSKLVESSLRARSLPKLEYSLLQEFQQPIDNCHANTNDKVSHQKPDDPTLETDNISSMLSSYQGTVRFLLEQDHYPGVSADDLNLFKSQFQSSAFTCRLSFCSRATTGFMSEELRRQHEIAHTKLSMCTVPDCQYPPFTSIRALKHHINKYHRQTPARRSIRRVGALPVPLLRYESSISESAADSQVPTSDAKALKGVTGVPEVSEPRAGKLVRQPRDIEELIKATEVAESRQSRYTLYDVAHVADNEDKEASKLDEILHVPIDAIGFRACAIQGCGTKLGTGAGEGPYSEGTSEFMASHYWNWHHADSMFQCAVGRCQMVFSSNHGLQAHYEQRHTSLFCKRCDATHQDGFDLEDELRYHWRSYHLRLATKWLCDGPAQPIAGMLDYSSCESCSHGHMFERQYDVVKHLRFEHFKPAIGTAEMSLSRSLEACARMVQVYEVVGIGGTWSVSENDGSSSEAETEILQGEDDMFYVKELA